MKVELIPSILAVDFAHLGDAVGAVREAGVRKVQVDVMDGHFVPNLTVGLPVVRALAREPGLLVDVHLMIEKPVRWVEAFVEAGAAVVTCHVEAEPHLHRAVTLVRQGGCRAGVAVNPGTPASALDAVLDQIDVALVMTVNPGFGGQEFITAMLPKIRQVRGEIDRRGLSVAVQVDGGIGPGTARQVVEAGATELVAGTSVYAADVPPADAVRRLQREIEDALAQRPD